MGLQDDRDLPPVKDDASDDTETSSGGVNKKRHLNMYDLVSTKTILVVERRRIIIIHIVIRIITFPLFYSSITVHCPSLK